MHGPFAGTAMRKVPQAAAALPANIAEAGPSL